jgi:hypothetical protein
MMPLEAASVIGALAGVAEISKEAFGKNGAAGVPAVSGKPARSDSVPQV